MEHDTKLPLKEIGWESTEGIHLTQIRDKWCLVKMVMNTWDP